MTMRRSASARSANPTGINHRGAAIELQNLQHVGGEESTRYITEVPYLMLTLCSRNRK